MVRFVVGSLNPAKLSAVEEVARTLFPGSRVEGIAVESGVPPQPRTDAETLRGAQQRARAVLQRAGGTLGVGIESGVAEVAERWFVLTWVAVGDVHGRMGLGCSQRLELPPAAAAALRGGETLYQAMQRLGTDPDRHGGAMGVLTAGGVSRESATRDALHCALARFRQPDLYRG